MVVAVISMSASARDLITTVKIKISQGSFIRVELFVYIIKILI